MYSERLLNSGERIRLLTHPHPISVVRPVAAGLLLVLAAFGLLLLGDWLDAAAGAGLLGTMLGAEPRRSMALLALIALFTGLACCACAWLIWNSTEYAVLAGPDGCRLLRVSGILSKRTVGAPLEKINDLVLVEPVLGRLLGYGDIEVKTGNDYSGQLLRFVPDPRAFCSVCRALRTGVALSAAVPASRW